MGPLLIIGLSVAWWLFPKLWNVGAGAVDLVDRNTQGIQHTAGSIVSAVDCTLGGLSESALGQGEKRLGHLNQELSELQNKLNDAENRDRWYVPNWLGDRGINDLTDKVQVKEAEILEQQKELERMIACWQSLNKIPSNGWDWLKSKASGLGDWGAKQFELLEGSDVDDGNSKNTPVHTPDTTVLHNGREVIRFQ